MTAEEALARLVRELGRDATAIALEVTTAELQAWLTAPRLPLGAKSRIEWAQARPRPMKREDA